MINRNETTLEFCEGQYHPESGNSGNNPSAHHATSGSPEFDYNNGPMSGLVRQREVEFRHVIPTPKPNKKFNFTFSSEDGLLIHFSTDYIGTMIGELESLSKLLESKRARTSHK